MSKFKVGDKVQLGGQGPEMHIETTNDVGGVSCIWFSKEEVMQREFLKEELLVAVEPRDDTPLMPVRAMPPPRGNLGGF